MERRKVKKIESLAARWGKHVHVIDAISGQQGDALTDDARLMLYEKAVLFYNNERISSALLCFLGCLKGIEPNTKFPMLPQCLAHTAKIFAETGDYGKAVQFMQGAKFYYQAAAIKAGVAFESFKREMSEVLNGCKSIDLDPCLDEGKRANEYEKLSHICLSKHKFLLALEYYGKTIKLRQQVYGDDRAVTGRSLEVLTSIFAEIGRVYYSEILKNYAALSESVQDNAPIQGTAKSRLAAIEEKARHCREIVDSKRETTADGEKPIKQTVVDKACFVVSEKMMRRRISDSIEMLTITEIIVLVALSSISAFLFNIVWCYFSKSDA